MTSRGFGAVALVLCLFAALIWVWSAEDKGQPSAPTTTSVGVAEEPQDQPHNPVEATESSSPTADTEVSESAPDREVVSDTKDETKLAVFKGRVVDEDSTPLAGALVKVWAGPANNTLVDAYVREHGEIEFESPEVVVTSDDGRFEVRFDPPPPFRFFLDASKEDFVPVTGRWSKIDPGTTKHFGDITLTRGVQVRGQLVDRLGHPVRPTTDRTSVSIDCYNRSDTPKGEITPRQSAQTIANSDGSFEFGHPIRPGIWHPHVRGLFLDGDQREVTIDASANDLRIVVHRPDTLLRASGVVVDDTGAPIQGAHVEVPEFREAGQRTVYTTKSGHFEIVQPPDAVSPNLRFSIRTQRNGYRDGFVEATCAFGDRDIRIAMSPIPAMEVLVVRDDDGTPVEEFGIRVFGAAGMRSSRERAIIDGWNHPGGMIRVTTMKRGGEKRVYVDPRSGTGLGTAMQVVEVDLESPPRLTIRLPNAVTQPIVLRQSDGTPIPGSAIELISPYGRPITGSSRVADFEKSGSSTNERGIVIDRAQTDEHGQCSLVGPSGTPLTIRCLGEHVPIVEAGWHLSETPRELTAPAGATLTVRVEPVEVINSWRRAAGLDASAGSAAEEARWAPKVSLLRRLGSELDRFPAGSRRNGIPLSADGAVFKGVPPGEWTVSFGYFHRRPGASISHGRFIEPPNALVLGPGDTRAFTFDASHYLTGTISGQLLINGEPASDVRQIILTRDLPQLGPDGRARSEQASLRLEQDGSFEGELAVGVWRGGVFFGGGYRSVQLPTTPAFSVAVGQVSRVTLNVTYVETELRVLNPGGAPAAALELYATTEAMKEPIQCRTDADGHATLGGPPGTYKVMCRIRSLNSPDDYFKALRQAAREAGGDIEAAHRALGDVELNLGEFELPVDAEPPIEIRLPPEWDR